MQQSTDSINWPPEFSELKRLDVILKCGICYDFMNNCMITSCSHTYCSICIRKFMHYKNQCPTCYEETYEINLRNNRLLDEVIHIYTKIRDKLLRASRLASVTAPPKYEPKERKSESSELPSGSTTTSPVLVENEITQNKTKRFDNRTTNQEQIKQLLKLPVGNDDSVVVNGVKVPGMFTSPKMTSTRPRRPEELTNCPVCEVKVPAKNINIHLDSCLALDPASKPKRRVRKRSPLPKRVYTMMPEKNLKKCLKDYGLGTSGDRKALIARLQRYTVIYNAENDAVNPRPVSELIKQLEREEREEKKPNSIMKNLQTTSARPTLPKNDIEAIEKANKAYCEENKASFKKLIEEMRARQGRNIKPLKPTNRIYSDEEDDPNKVVSTNCDDFPTTSGCTSSKESNSSPHSTGSENNIRKETKQDLVDSGDDDSDGDIFMNSDAEDKPVYGRIDWNKTAISASDQATPESIYDLATQKPVDEIDLISDVEGDNIMEDKHDKETEEKSSGSLSTDYGDSDGSMFDTFVKKSNSSTSKQKVTKPKKPPRRGRPRLSLPAKKTSKKGRKTTKEKPLNESVLEGCESDHAADSDIVPDTNSKLNEANEDKHDNNDNGKQNSDIDDFPGFLNINDNIGKPNGELNDTTKQNSETDNNDKIVDKNFDNSVVNDIVINNCNKDNEEGNNEITPEGNLLNGMNVEEESAVLNEGIADSSILEGTPMRRLTRSAKRKSVPNQELRSEELNTTPTSRKKTKRDLSPAFD